MSFLKNDRTFKEPISKLTTFFMVLFHIGAVAALFFFSWKAAFLAAVLWWFSGSLGIGMGYHRLLTHRGYKTPKWIEYFLTTCGALALEGGPFFWVATHRVHHQNTDREGDPHSPRDGGFWAHMGWIMTGRGDAQPIRRLCFRTFPTFAKTSSIRGSANGTGFRSQCWASRSSRLAAGSTCCGASS